MLTQENTEQLTLSPDGLDTTLDTPGLIAPNPALFERQAMRFLLDRHLGRLLTESPDTGEAHVSPVHYVMDPLSGAFVTQLPAGSEHAAVLRQGGRSVLSVPTSTVGVRGGDRYDHAGLPTGAGIWHVQADVDIEVLDDPEAVRHVLRSQITDVFDGTGQSDDDPTDRAPRAILSDLVALRMRPTAIWARTR